MKNLVIPAALLALLGSAALASAQSAHMYTPADTMQRDGGHSGRLGDPNVLNARPYRQNYTGRSAAEDQSPRYVQPEANHDYQPGDSSVQVR